jgi:hypothetical protein
MQLPLFMLNFPSFSSKSALLFSAIKETLKIDELKTKESSAKLEIIIFCQKFKIGSMKQ